MLGLDVDQIQCLRCLSNNLFGNVLFLSSHYKIKKYECNIKKRINLLLDVLFSFSRKPIRIVSSIGAITALGGLIFGITVIIERLNGTTGSQGTASLIALVSFTSGLVLLTLGIIAEYIWRIWDEVNNRPDGIEKFKG